MRKGIGLARVLTIGVITFGWASTNIWAASVRAGKITYTVGNVKLIRGGKSRGARVNMFVRPGDKLKAGRESVAELTLKGGSKVRIEEKSEFVMRTCTANPDGSRNTEVFVRVGEVMCNIRKMSGKKGAFSISTPTATAAIRGTIFQTVVSSDGTSMFSVLQGAVAVKPAGSRRATPVRANQQAKVSKKTKTVAAQAIPPAQKQKLVQKAKKVELKPAPKPKPQTKKAPPKKKDKKDSKKTDKDKKAKPDSKKEDPKKTEKTKKSGETKASTQDAPASKSEGKDPPAEESQTGKDEAADPAEETAGQSDETAEAADETGEPGQTDETGESADLAGEEAADQAVMDDEFDVVDEPTDEGFDEDFEEPIDPEPEPDVMLEQELMEPTVPDRSEVPPEEIIQEVPSPSSP